MRKVKKGEENFDVIASPEQPLCFLVTLANKPRMHGGEKKKPKRKLSPSGGKRPTSPTNQLTAKRDKTQTGKHANSPSWPAPAPANEAGRGV